MASENFNKAIAALNSLTAEELNDLVPHWKAISKHKKIVRGAAIVAKNEFNVGDILGWYSNKRGRLHGQHYMKFANMNRNGTSVQGRECDKDGNLMGLGKWTVDVGMVKKVA